MIEKLSLSCRFLTFLDLSYNCLGN
jgi:hypothetical protein